MKKVLAFLVLFLLVGCEQKFDLDANGKLAMQYLLDEGYTIKSYDGNYVYNVSKQDLVRQPHYYMWGVQSVSPDPYIGKDVIQERFTVKNHPLSKLYGPIAVSVFIYNGEVIGGTSFPAEGGMVGAPHSLDGKTLEEVIGQNDTQKWWKEWEEKYSKNSDHK
ncbi:hypothetical protein A8F94_15295 [Bacillus sp. FJAT-27225]|nr:hypothetical protein A8F94_15295 [Bacillus sp. FJAT-27225]